MLFWSAPVMVFRGFYLLLFTFEGNQIFLLLLQSHKEERLKDEQKKASSLSSLNGCLLMCLAPFWLLPNLLHWLERNHGARRRGDSHQMMRNILLFHCLGPNQSPARAGSGKPGHHMDKPALPCVGAGRGVAGSGVAHPACLHVSVADGLWRWCPLEMNCPFPMLQSDC